MSKYSLQYRAARRRAFTSKPISQKPTAKTNSNVANPASQVKWQNASFIGFNPSSGLYRVKNSTGEISQVERIPGYGAEFGGVATGSMGLLSQGFWSN